jgi:hypothetical protein
LPGPYTPSYLVKEGVYIHRQYPVDNRVEDYKYQVPTEQDTMEDILSAIGDGSIKEVNNSSENLGSWPNQDTWKDWESWVDPGQGKGNSQSGKDKK